MSAQAHTEHPQPRRPRGDAAPGGRRAERTPLSVVPAPLPRSGPGLAVLCVTVLLAALAALLVMNVTVSNRQYELLDLRAQQQEVSVANEQLAERVGTLEAPQNLAARADALGMVTAGGTGSLDAATGTFTDAPEGAEGQGGGLSTSYVAPPASGTEDAASSTGTDLQGPRTGTSSPAPSTADTSSAAPSESGTAGD